MIIILICSKLFSSSKEESFFQKDERNEVETGAGVKLNIVSSKDFKKS